MSIAKKFRIVATATCCVIVALTLLLGGTAWMQVSLNRAQTRRQESYRLAVLLRQTSDELTRLVRSFVVTANPADERDYLHLVAVQDGQEPWPDGTKISIRDKMRAAGMTDAELAKLQVADQESNALVATETAAINAVKGLFDDGAGRFTKQGPPNPELARRLVHDANYNGFRDKINAPVSEFEQMLDARTGAEVAAATTRMQVALALMGLLVLCLSALIFLTLRSVNLMLRRTADQLESGAEELSSAATQVASASQVLASGSSEQAASLEETSAAAEEIRSVAAANAEHAQDASKLMVQAKSVDRDVDGKIDEMAKAMSDITQSSQQISRIIRTVEDIAFQTNILALNAAVEAARAGDLGLGFAVVADEVRNLAQRSSGAARETGALIEQAMSRTSAGQQHVESVISAIKVSRSMGEQVGGLIQDVNAASREQASGIEGIARAILQMQEITQKTAATAEEASASSEELQAQSQNVLDLARELRLAVGAK